MGRRLSVVIGFMKCKTQAGHRIEMGNPVKIEEAINIE
jgi:hypothetical protein